MLATAGGAVGSEVTSGYSFENARPSKVGAKSGKKGGLKAKTAGRKKESGEKGGTEDIDIGGQGTPETQEAVRTEHVFV